MTAPCPTCGATRADGSDGSDVCARCAAGAAGAAMKPWSLPKKIGIAGSLAVAIALTVAQLIWPRLDPEEAKALEAIQRCRSEANDPIFDPGMRRLAQTPCDMLAQQYIARYGRKP